MTKRIALATSAEHAELHPHDLPLVGALRAAGLDPVAEVWTDPSVDWSAYDAILLRSVSDYHRRYDEFTEWLAQVDKIGVPVLNDSGLVRWNGDKRYLLELRERGVAIVPSQVAAGPCLREVVGGLNGQEIVVKPTVSASGELTTRGVAGSAEFEQAMAELRDVVYLVQPFVPEVQADGEWSVMFVDGEFTHAVLKQPGGQATLTEPTPAVLAGARAALEAAGRTPVYARVDGVVVNGRFLLMELELIEPYLFLPDFPEATQKLASAVAARV